MKHKIPSFLLFSQNSSHFSMIQLKHGKRFLIVLSSKSTNILVGTLGQFGVENYVVNERSLAV